MTELFGKPVSAINEHVKNIYVENELKEAVPTRKFGNSEFSTKVLKKPLVDWDRTDREAVIQWAQAKLGFRD